MGFPSEQCSCMISRAGKFLSCTSHASATPQGDCWCGVRACKRNRHLHGKGLEPDSSHQRSDTISRQAGCSVPMGSQDNHSRTQHALAKPKMSCERPSRATRRELGAARAKKNQAEFWPCAHHRTLNPGRHAGDQPHFAHSRS
jgi:hypothetical protein